MKHLNLFLCLNVLTSCCWDTINAFSTRPLLSSPRLLTNNNNNNMISLHAKDDDISNDLSKLPDNIGNDNGQEAGPKLGIDIGSVLDPLTEKEAAELKAAATEVINDAVAAGLDDIEKLRTRLKREIEQKRNASIQKSESLTKLETTKLLNKIDNLTNDFLSQTLSSRQQTKLAATADQNNIGKGLEVGVWGTVQGAAVTTTNNNNNNNNNALIGSVTSATKDTTTATTSQQAGILVLGDVSSDPYAKQITPILTEKLNKLFDTTNLPVYTYKPTQTVPLGGDNAACIVLYCTSYTDSSTVKMVLERALRKTVTSDSIGQPPTQIVAISTVGTERTNTMPYSMQNLMGGGKLEKRRQIEETIIRYVHDNPLDTGLDYTICKLGELKDNKKDNTFNLLPGDDLDGTIDSETAATVLAQAMAIQPSARNTTFSCIGTLPSDDNNQQQQIILDDAFLKLEGPELLRMDIQTNNNIMDNYNSLSEYINEWSMLLAKTGKGLTTPIRSVYIGTNIIPSYTAKNSGVTKQSCIQILFLPTATGKNYISKDEERIREKQQGSSSSTTSTTIRNVNTAKEGGIEFVVELCNDNNTQLRVRAKRCNYGIDAIIKEISEETILSNFRKSIDVWKKDHQK